MIEFRINSLDVSKLTNFKIIKNQPRDPRLNAANGHKYPCERGLTAHLLVGTGRPDEYHRRLKGVNVR